MEHRTQNEYIHDNALTKVQYISTCKWILKLVSQKHDSASLVHVQYAHFRAAIKVCVSIFDVAQYQWDLSGLTVLVVSWTVSVGLEWVDSASGELDSISWT